MISDEALDKIRKAVREHHDIDGDKWMCPDVLRAAIDAATGHTEMVKAAVDLLALSERMVVMIDSEWGRCRGLAQLEKDNELPLEILDMRKALATHGGTRKEGT
jgi:hypothetical protein